MSKNSANSVSCNSIVWTKNLVIFKNSIKKRQSLFKYIVDSIEHMSKMPKEVVIVGRYLALAEFVKSREGRLKQISQEVTALWQKMNFPIQSSQTVKRKVTNIINTYDKHLKNPSRKTEESFTNVFDITNSGGEWLCTEDKQLYKLQVHTKGGVGYTTEKEACKKGIHPRKRIKLPFTNTRTSTSYDFDEVPTSTSESETQYSSSNDSNSDLEKKVTHHSTNSAQKLVRYAKLSSYQARNACNILHEEAPQIATPSQSGIYRAVYKEAMNLEKTYIDNLKNELWCLHFDGKLIANVEHQVVVLKNAENEIKLAVLALSDAKSATIADAIINTLDKFHLWNSIKMIVCDTTAVNTGRHNGVIVRLQRKFEDHNYNKPVYIGCQHHILDRVLKHVFGQLFGESSVSPDITYPFVYNVINNYVNLKEMYQFQVSINPDEEEKDIGWRNDMNFLYQLVKAFNYYKRYNLMIKLKFQALPKLSNARWNSRAIYALLSYFLVPDSRGLLDEVCIFISGKWSNIWFGGQMFNEHDYQDLRKEVQKYPKAASCLNNHWSIIPSPLNTQRSNICAERAIKVLQDLYPLCRSPDKLNLRFLMSNK